MAAPTLAQISAGIETQLKTISGLRTSPYIPDQINPPHAVVPLPHVTAYHSTAQRGYIELEGAVILYVQRVVDRIDQTNLGAFMDLTGALSIPVAIENDRTLGGLDLDCIVRDTNPTEQVTVGGVEYLSVRFNLQIIARGA